MSDTSDRDQQNLGIGGLPRRWGVAVQLVGTFGLAVFLVLYYVLVMHPMENARYEKLRTSVETLIGVVEKGQSLLTREQASKLENLFIMATAPAIADRVMQDLQGGVITQELAKELENIMMVQTGLLAGLTRKDGGSLSEMLTYKIRNSGVAEKISLRADERWRGVDRTHVVEECKEALDMAFRLQARAK